MAPWAFPPCKYAVNMAVARGTVNLQGFWSAAILGPPSADIDSENKLFKEASQLRSFIFGRVVAPIEVVTGHCKNAGI